MTIPIIPGPFSFLGEAGQAAGAVGDALLARRKRELEEGRQQLAGMLDLVSQGASVPIPAFVDAGRRAGLQINEQTATDLFELAKRRARASLRTGEATARGTEADAAIKESQVPVAPGMAAAGLRTAQAGATSAETEAAAGQTELPVKQRIAELVQTELKKPETNFGRLAARAAAGILPYYSALLQLRYQNNALKLEQMREQFKLFFEPMDNASTVWRDRLNKWEMRRQTETLPFSDDQEEIKKWEQANPQPTLEAVQQELLQSAAGARGLTVEQYNQKMNQMVGLVGEAEEISMPPGKIKALKERVAAVLAGAKTPEQAISEITIYYRSRGGADAQLMSELDIAEFRRLLQEAQAPSGRKR